MAWVGLNTAGFAIMNSVAYNLPYESGEEADLEGIIMSDSLRTCQTADDFENYIQNNLGPRFGSKANFGVIDAFGGSALFEVHNHGYKRFDTNDFPEKYIANTNFSKSGEPDEGRGYLRFDRVTQLFISLHPKKLSHEYILQVVSRDLGHTLVLHPPLEEWKKFSPDNPVWVHANRTINRVYTSASVVIHGVKEGENPKKATMWVILGEPVCSIAVPLWTEAGCTPSPFREGKAAPICREAYRLKNILRPFKDVEKREYADITKLDNKAGTGWLPLLLETEKEIFEKTRAFLGRNPGSAELAEFEKKMAFKALSTLEEIQ